MFQPWLFVGFVGHRELAQPALIAQQIERALDRLAELSPGPVAAVSSLASGADTLFVEAAVRRSLPWTLLLPFPLAQFREDFTPDDWARAERLLPHAVRTRVEPRADSRDELYLECAIRTIEECDVLLAVWDGQPARGMGGTGDSMAQARALKKPLIWIHAVTGELMPGENLDRLPSHPAAPAPLPPLGPDTLDATYAHFDRLATRQQPGAHNLTHALIVLHQSATLIAIAALVWSQTGWLTGSASWIKLGVLVLALWLPRLLHHSQDGWMRHRLKAELCRSAQAVWPLQHPDEVFTATRLPVETGLQRSLVLLRYTTPPPPLDLAAAKTAYRTRRVDDQAAYFADQAARSGRLRRRLRRCATACTVAAIAAGVTVGLLLSKTHALYPLIKFSALGLPLVAAIFLASLASLDLERRVARFREIASFLDEARQRVANAGSSAGLNRVVIDVERTLLLEVWEWYSLKRFASHH